MKAYLFWYKFDYESPTEYVYVVAVSLKQATFLWLRYIRENLGFVHAYDKMPCNEIEQAHFLKPHKVGEVLGCNAVI